MHAICPIRLKKDKQLLENESHIFTLRDHPTDPMIWFVDFVGPEKTLYEGEHFTWANQTPVQILTALRCIKKPMESPEVIFVGHIPKFKHIYSNGYICLSVLYDGRLIRLERGDDGQLDLLLDPFDAGWRQK